MSGLRAELVAPLDAFGAISILPLPRTATAREDLHLAVKWFPLVGVALGVSVALLDLALRPLVSVTVASVVELGALALASGGLHLDGLADTADGLFPVLPRERRLEVMRSPTIGAFGAATLVLVLLLEYAALAGLAGSMRTIALVVAPTTARASMVALLVLLPNARPRGLGGVFKQGLGPLDLVVPAALTAISAVWLGVPSLVLVVAGLIPAFAVGGWALRALGGCTGDIYGGAGELACASVLIIAGLLHL
jgi:adenosylcobinamide-GDP ribazoletransferase